MLKGLIASKLAPTYRDRVEPGGALTGKTVPTGCGV